MSYMINKVKYDGILFLDIDGVLLPDKVLSADEVFSSIRDPDGALDMLVARSSKLAVGTVKAWCDSNAARCVLISSWRHTFSQPFIERYLTGLALFPAYFHLDWCAPIRGFSSSKGEDMWEWLSAHANIKHYTVVDDHDLLLERYKHTCRQIFVRDPTLGLTPGDVKDLTLKGLKTRKHYRKWSERAGKRVRWGKRAPGPNSIVPPTLRPGEFVWVKDVVDEAGD